MGPFDESFDYALDWDFILRMQARGLQFRRVPRFLGGFRVHEAQKTSTQHKGMAESSRLRLTHLGFDPTAEQIHSAITGYLRRHVSVSPPLQAESVALLKKFRRQTPGILVGSGKGHYGRRPSPFQCIRVGGVVISGETLN